jgi:tungstate transport system permease protein
MIREGFRLIRYDPYLHGQIHRTLHLAFEATAIALLLGILPAYWIGVRTTRFSRWGLIVANAALGLPSVAIGIFLFYLLPRTTPWGGSWYQTMNGMIAGQVVLALPIVVALGAAAIRGLPDGLIDQARGFGASGWRLLLFALREAKIGVMTAVILALGSAIAEVGAVTILGGNQDSVTATVASQILNDFNGIGFTGVDGTPSEVEHAIVVLAMMAILAILLTIVQQWEGVRGRIRRRRSSAAPTAEGAQPGVVSTSAP